MKDYDKVGKTGNIVLIWALLFSTLVVFGYLHGYGRELVESWFGDSNAFVCMIKYTIISFPFFALALYFQTKLELDEKEASYKSYIFTYVGTAALLSVGGLVFWTIVYFTGDSWWMVRVVVLSIFTLVVVPLMTRQMAKNAKDIDDEHMLFVLKRVFDKTGYFLDKANFIKGKNFMSVGINPKHKTLFINSELAEKLTDDELEATFLHECGHIKYYWFGFFRRALSFVLAIFKIYFVYWVITQVLHVKVTTDNAFVWAYFYLMAIYLVNKISALPLLFLSRYEENLADEYVVKFNGHGKSLASALRKLFDLIPLKFKESMVSVENQLSHPEIRRRILRLEKFQAK